MDSLDELDIFNPKNTHDEHSLEEVDMFKVGPSGTCMWCGELKYGSHDECEELYEIGQNGGMWVFSNPAFDPNWYAWECFGASKDDLYLKYEKEYGRTRKIAESSDLVPVFKALDEIPDKYRPKGRALDRACHFDTKKVLDTIKKQLDDGLIILPNPDDKL
jgi:hypothetical protein